MSESKVLVCVIGSNGLYQSLDNLTLVETLNSESRDALRFSIFQITISRHDLPSGTLVALLAFSAGEEIPPGDLCLPSQIINRANGIRLATSFTGNIVAHASFADPFSKTLSAWLEVRVAEPLKKGGLGVSLHTDKTIVCMEGPQVLPEAKLPWEGELSYALIATATDYDSWRPLEAGVTAG
ncbi:hypothetical protein C8R43DRAFT_1127341 [Mycena crocata]|nr:hypothetical protein C8R43DRAFT_1127341 [Mycena crocata]